MLSGNIQMLKALGCAFVALCFFGAAALGLLRGKAARGLGWMAAGFALLGVAFVFETLSYVLPPADSFEGGLVHIAGFLGGTGMGAPLVTLGLILFRVRGKQR